MKELQIQRNSFACKEQDPVFCAFSLHYIFQTRKQLKLIWCVFHSRSLPHAQPVRCEALLQGSRGDDLGLSQHCMEDVSLKATWQNQHQHQPNNTGCLSQVLVSCLYIFIYIYTYIYIYLFCLFKTTKNIIIYIKKYHNNLIEGTWIYDCPTVKAVGKWAKFPAVSTESSLRPSTFSMPCHSSLAAVSVSTALEMRLNNTFIILLIYPPTPASHRGSAPEESAKAHGTRWHTGWCHPAWFCSIGNGNFWAFSISQMGS